MQNRNSENNQGLPQDAIKVENLCIGYGGKPILEKVNLELRKGEVVALLGANGTGKSTLIRSLSRELKALEGKIFIEGRDIRDFTQKQLAETMAIVTTDRTMASGMRVHEIVEMGRHPHNGIFARISASDREIVDNAMKIVGIDYKRNSYFAELSDGERQKTMIARAIVQQSDIILLDEPFSFLDPSARIEIMDVLKQIARRRNTAIMLSSHDVAQAVRMADRLFLLTLDKKIVGGTACDLIENGTINHLFKSKMVIFDRTQNDFVETGSNRKVVCGN